MNRTAGTESADHDADHHTDARDRGHAWRSLAPCLLLMAAGTLLRLLWPLDMEWKFDEKWMFATAQRIASGAEPWPWIGMPSGVGTRNPGLSIWPFALLAQLSRDPVAMVEAIQWLNVIALWGFAAWAFSAWPKSERDGALWGVALFAVSPLAVLFSRKIWAQDVLVVFVVPWLWGHRRREHVVGAVLWGLCGALLGQVHMSGFFAAFALAIVTLVQDRKRFPWRGWLLGSVLGVLPMLPWLKFLITPHAAASVAGQHYSLHFFREALRHMWGLGLAYPLEKNYPAFLRGPHWHGVATHLNDVARYALYLLLAFAIIAGVRDRKHLRLSEPVRTYLATVLLAGVLLSAAGVEIYAHYLIVFGPLLHIVAAWTLTRYRGALLALCCLQLWLSITFAYDIHRHGGAPDADYGKSYRAQTDAERQRLAP